MKKQSLQIEQTVEDFGYSINETGEFRDTWRIFRIMAEFVEGYQFLSKFEKSVTVLGSARLDKNHKYSQVAYEFGKLLAKNGYSTVTGGGPGIMEAANQGAFEAKGESIGLNIQLPREQRVNPFVTQSIAFYYFFTRKVMLTAPATAFVLFPGGFGTMDEFFEIVDMIELGVMPKIPIILVGTDYWQPLINYLRTRSIKDNLTSEEVIGTWHLVDSAEEALKIIKGNAVDLNLCDFFPNNFRCEKNLDWKIFRIMAELVEGFEFLTGLVEDITILGTKSIKPDSDYYLQAYRLGRKLGEENYTVVTGGASGVAEAANKGAIEVGGKSFGIGMEVAGKSRVNPYVSKSIIFKFPFTRKVIITAPSKAFVFFPGCFGTMHNLFEILTLIETKKMQSVPIILFGSEYWNGLTDFIDEIFVKKFKTVNPSDAKIYQIVDHVDEVVRIINETRK